MVNNMQEKVIEIISKISKVSVNDLIDNMDTPKLWDSISHVEIVLTLEGEFDVSFDENDIGNMVTVNKVLHCLSGKIDSK
jgi:acyl carrier protein